jgi:hypothetical protein
MGSHTSKIINKKNTIQVSTNIVFCNYCNCKIFKEVKDNICNKCKEEIILKRLNDIGML